MRRLLAVFGLVTGAFAAQAQTAPQAVASWLDREIAMAAKPLELGDCAAEWVLKITFTPSAPEMAALRERVSGHPDHPEQGLLAAYERRARGEPDMIGRTLWLSSIDKLRFNSQYSEGYLDSVVTPRVTWSLSHTTLELGYTGSASEATSNIRAEAGSFRGELPELLFGAIAPISGAGMQLDGAVSVNGDRWSALFAREFDDGSRHAGRVSGTWDATAGRGFANDYTVTEASRTPGNVGYRVEYDGWTFDDRLARWVAGEVRYFRPDGSLDRVLAYRGTNCETSAAEATRVPTKRRPDPIRGSVDTRRVNDHTGGRLASGQYSRELVSIFDSGDHRSPWLRRLGWISAASIAAAVVVFGIRRRMSP